MGNIEAAKNEQIVSTVWLGLIDEWPISVKSMLNTKCDQQWAAAIIKNLNYDQAKQISFCNLLQAVCNYLFIFKVDKKGPQLESTKDESVKVLRANSYLLMTKPNMQRALLSSQPSINLSLSMSRKTTEHSEEQIFTVKKQEQPLQTAQKQVEVLQAIKLMLNNSEHPFQRMIATYQHSMIQKLQKSNDLQRKTNGFNIQKAMISQSSCCIRQFCEFIHQSLLLYIRSLKKQQYSEFFKQLLPNLENTILAEVVNNSITVMLLEMLKNSDNNFNSNMRNKLLYFAKVNDNLLEILDISPKLINDTCQPFHQAIQCLKDIQFQCVPSEKMNVLVNTEQIIRDSVNKPISNYKFIQILNFVIINARIVTIQSEFNLLSLFFQDNETLLKFGQSLEYIHNIVIS